RGAGDGRGRLPAQTLQSTRVAGAHQRDIPPQGARRTARGAVARSRHRRFRRFRARSGYAHVDPLRRTGGTDDRRVCGTEGVRTLSEGSAVAREADGDGPRPRIRGVRSQPGRADLAAAQADRTGSVQAALHSDGLGPGLRLHPGRNGLRLRSPPLFWRTFLLILLLFVACLAAWWPTVRVIEREPRARQIAQLVVSIVNTTRSALVYSDPQRRRYLLSDLADNEGIRVVPLEPGDQVEPLPDNPLASPVSRNVRAKLGQATRLASKVNGVAGVWVSFSIDDGAYWVFIDRDIFTESVGREWMAWAALAAIISLLIAAAIAGLVNRPMAELSRAAAGLGAGRTPRSLPGGGPPEIRMVNRSFNRMLNSLERHGRERAGR